MKLIGNVRWKAYMVKFLSVERKKERKCNDLKCARKPTKSRLGLTVISKLLLLVFTVDAR